LPFSTRLRGFTNTMPYSILSVAYPFTYVGENSVGGSEQVLTLLDRALTENGHRSIVIAAEGSEIRGTLIPSPAAPGLLDPSVREWGQKVHRRLLRETLSRYPVDLVHMHSLDFHQYLPPPSTPTLATLHLPPDWYPARIFRRKREHFYMNCVSFSQQKACPSQRMLLPIIPNGVDIARLATIRRTKRNYVLALGRICPEKAFHVALDAAKRADVDFVLAGEVAPYADHKRYFRTRIAPRLDQRRQFIGPANFETKRRLLGEAKCLLVTSEVQETSSLVAMEALATGTPVIAFPTGALLEIVEHGKTGFLAADVQGMAKAIGAVDRLDPEDCRNAARRNFSAEKMIKGYTDTYRRVIGKGDGVLESTQAMSAGSWLVNW
jgi:glycosyltransferase involved in cell wall biosynthesis